MTFEAWWVEFIKHNLTCLNHKSDFEKCWKAAKELSK